MLRLFTLVVGPPLIVGLAWIVARPDGGQRRGLIFPEPVVAGAPFSARDASPVTDSEHVPKPNLIEKCQRTREVLMRRLGTRFSSIVHPPFVILGDIETARLERHYRETISRAARAMAISYFDTPPDEPISIVLLSGDEMYESCVERLDGERRGAFAGYYQRNDHRIVVNLSTGDGTIAHELAHALGHFDFPAMPEWFDEGLASLHEEARFSKDHLRIVGIPNCAGVTWSPPWRTGRSALSSHSSRPPACARMSRPSTMRMPATSACSFRSADCSNRSIASSASPSAATRLERKHCTPCSTFPTSRQSTASFATGCWHKSERRPRQRVAQSRARVGNRSRRRGIKAPRAIPEAIWVAGVDPFQVAPVLPVARVHHAPMRRRLSSLKSRS